MSIDLLRTEFAIYSKKTSVIEQWSALAQEKFDRRIAKCR